MSNYQIAGLPKPMYEYLACNVTIFNRSTQKLLNAEIVKSWGKYTTDPQTNIFAKTDSKFVMMGRSGAISGCEGSVEYDVGDLGMGTVKFYYTCPYSGDNMAVPTNTSPLLIVSLYANTTDGFTWDQDGKNWGTEGQVPNDGHPLNILFVLTDLTPPPPPAR